MYFMWISTPWQILELTNKSFKLEPDWCIQSLCAHFKDAFQKDRHTQSRWSVSCNTKGNLFINNNRLKRRSWESSQITGRHKANFWWRQRHINERQTKQHRQECLDVAIFACLPTPPVTESRWVSQQVPLLTTSTIQSTTRCRPPS